MRSIATTSMLLAALWPAWTEAADGIDFDRAIRPILADTCYACHGPDENARQGGLRLDQEMAAKAPADSGATAIVPGHPEESELIRRITSSDASERMPPADSNLSLTVEQQLLLAQWIREGAEFQQHWSFRAIQRPELPSAAGRKWVANGIDAFLLEAMQARNLAPSPDAERYRLLRRLYLDLTGLPPTTADADAWMADTRVDAYEQLVDKLLASPAFGERMAWDWLDAARYADTNGYQGDRERTMWPWRDWVVAAFNANQPFDQFTLWQLAGDLLPEAGPQQILATGFCRNHMINGEGGRIAEENRVDYVMDMTETMGTVWLGLTLNCCRCHDHKFDPLSQRDYYSLSAFFNQTPVTGEGGDPQTPPLLAVPSVEQLQTTERLAAEVTALRSELEQLEKQLATSSDNAELSEELRSIALKPLPERSAAELKKLSEHWQKSNPAYSETLAQLSAAMDKRAAADRAIPRVMVMQDRAERRPTYVLTTGLYNRTEEEVKAGLPELFDAGEQVAATRLDLARWVTADDNPLTARVVVNRVWQHFFGRGLVKTVDDFGTQGERPSHAELLDWLADDFRRSGWDLKRLCRQIVCSRAYRQSSRVRPESLERDPENIWLARGARYRLPSWVIRDQALAAGGLLVHQIGGPPVKPYQPAGVWEEATFGKITYRQDSGSKLYRRSLYTFWRRIIGPTLFFDSASRQTCEVRPARTNSPLHALTTLNDTTYVEAARGLAQSLLSSAGEASDTARLETAFRRVLVRPPNEAELQVLLDSLGRLRQQFVAQPEAARRLIKVGELDAVEVVPATELAAWTGVCNLLLNLDETVTRE